MAESTSHDSVRRIRGLVYLFSLTALLLAPTIAAADDYWPSFRNAGTSTTVTRGLPINWSTDEGIAWRSTIGGYGQSAPVVYKGVVYVTSSDGPFQQRCFVHAFDLATGDQKWTSEVQATTKVENYFRNSRAAPTCAVDENIVVSFFASGDVTAMNHDGETLWSQPLFQLYGEVDNERGTASSPAQNKDLVFIVVDHGGPSYAVALRKSDGQVAWKTDRGHRVPSWSSPVLVRSGGREVLVISSSDTVDAYDAESGELLWQVSGLSGNHIPSATVAEGSVYVGSTQMYGSDADPDDVAGSNCRIDLTQSDAKPGYQIRWSAQRANSYYSSPLAFAGYVYYVNKSGVLYCIDQETGERKFAKRIGNPCWASAIGVTTKSGEQYVYFVTKNGFTVVLRPGDEYEQVARNRLWDAEEMIEAADAARAARKANAVPADQAKPKTGPERVFAGMPESALHEMFSYGDPTVYAAAVAEGRLLIRTGQHLYCVGATKE